MARLKEMWLDDKHQDTSVDLTAIYAAKDVPPHQCRLELLYDFLDVHHFMLENAPTPRSSRVGVPLHMTFRVRACS